MMKLLQILLLLSIVSLSPATAYICDDDTSSPTDAFEEHGCFCGTSRTTFHFPRLYDSYQEAFHDCHEGVGFVDTIIECMCFLTTPGFMAEFVIEQNFAARNTGGPEWRTDIQ